LNKTKLKAKGKKYYKNTHGTVYRVKQKLNKRVLLKKRQAKLDDQVKVA